MESSARPLGERSRSLRFDWREEERDRDRETPLDVVLV